MRLATRDLRARGREGMGGREDEVPEIRGLECRDPGRPEKSRAASGPEPSKSRGEDYGALAGVLRALTRPKTARRTAPTTRGMPISGR